MLICAFTPKRTLLTGAWRSDTAMIRRGDLVVALFGFACAPAAWASYGQMRFDGLNFFLAVVLLYLWSFPLALGLGLGWGKHKVFVFSTTAVTVALTSLLIAVFNDGRATMLQRPLGEWAVFVILLLAAVPAMLAAPFLQRAWHAQGNSSRIPVAMLVGALVLVPAGSFVYNLLQESHKNRVLAQAHALTPGRVLPHVTASRDRAASSWLSPYFWNEEAELKWIVVGLGRAGFIESPAPLSSEDTQALALLVKSSARPGKIGYAWTLESKLIWDRLMRAGPGDKFAVVADLTRPHALNFIAYIGVPHADWLCTPLEDPETKRAFDHMWALLSDPDKERFSAAIREKCGRAIGVPAM